MGRNGAENGAQRFSPLPPQEEAEIPKWGAVGLKMGGSAEIPNFSPVQALKMGGSEAENGGQR